MILVKHGDITFEEVDVIVNAANTRLAGGGGVDGAIHRAAGPLLMRECAKIGGCKTGEAVITNGYNLKAGKVIHTVGPVWRNGEHNESQLLTNAYRNSLILAKKHSLRTIAFPAISTGVYGYPVEPAARIALSVGKEFYHDFDEIRYISYSQKDFDIYNRVWNEIKHEVI